MNNFFDLDIPKSIYKVLNKDKSLAYHFRSSNVGKCVKIYDDFIKQGGGLKDDWKKYYFSVRPQEPLIIALKFITNKYSYDYDVAKKYVLFRVIGQTWNGMEREKMIIKELSDEFPNIIFKKADYEKDEQFFTDWEAFEENALIFGIQIKPLSYFKMCTPYQLKAKENHKKQAELYKKKYQVPHIIVYYDGGKLHEPQKTFDKINTIILFQIEVISRKI